MRNSLGNPARGDAFFPREKEIKKIYRVLVTGASIYLSAPRRVGKTSILKRLEEFPQNNYCFIYVITESIDTQNDFFKVVFEELIKSEAIKKLAKVSSSVKDFLSGLLSRVKSIQNIELREGEESDYFEILIELLSHIKPEYGKVVLMIDEFPQTIQNIIDKDGDKSAEIFIQKNRELRHHQHILDKISFIYTGSVSLFPMIEKVTSLTSINDVRTVEVNPLERSEAKIFIASLMENDDIILSDEMIDYTLSCMIWLIPFHLQLIQQEIVDVYESSGEEIDKASIDKAFEQIVHSRNKPQFEPYFSRLRKIFKDNDYDFATEILKYIAEHDVIDIQILTDKVTKHGIIESKVILDILEGDGYLFKHEDCYKYTSPILQLWCKKHICK